MGTKSSLHLQEPPASPASGVTGSGSRGPAEESAQQGGPWGGVPPLRGLGAPGTQCGGLGGAPGSSGPAPVGPHSPGACSGQSWPSEERTVGHRGVGPSRDPGPVPDWLPLCWRPQGSAWSVPRASSQERKSRVALLSRSIHSGRISLSRSVPEDRLLYRSAFFRGPCLQRSSGSEDH